MAIKTAEIKTAKTKRAKVIATAATMTKTTKNKTHRIPAPTKTALKLVGDTSKTDVNGSYTGVPKNKTEKPVQDADDL